MRVFPASVENFFPQICQRGSRPVFKNFYFELR